MEIFLSLGFLSYVASGLAFLFLLVIYLLTVRKGDLNVSFLLLLLGTLAWSGILVLSQVGSSLPFELVSFAEFARYFIWLNVLHHAAGYYLDRSARFKLTNPLSPVSVLLLFVISLVVLIFNSDLVALFDFKTPHVVQIICMLVFSVIGLLLIEQVVRNTPEADRYSINLLCISAGLVFIYDFFVFSDALLLQHIDYDLWSARGMVNVIAIPTLLLAAVRNPRMAPYIQISRKFVLHSTTLFATGLYLLLMSIAGYYINESSEEWGKLAQAVFLTVALLLLALLFFSADIKTRIRRYLSYSFQNKFDYRDEWNRFSNTLLVHDPSVSIYQRAIQAAGQIVDSKGGALWVRDEQKYVFKGAWKTEPVSSDSEGIDSLLVNILGEKQEIMTVDEINRHLERAGQGKHWIVASPEIWIVLPLVINDELYGFIYLEQPLIPRTLDIADLDLLHTVASHVALALFLNETDGKLLAAQRFKDLNQMTAFLVHDLKTVFSQLSLLVENAAAHKDNPDFIDDMIGTVEHTVQKMQRLLEQLRNPDSTEPSQLVDLTELIEELLGQYGSQAVKVELEVDTPGRVLISCDKEKLQAAIRHIVQNAIESMDKSGKVELRLYAVDEFRVGLDIEDSGAGMSQEFITEELFKPFASTKGVSGMGVGVYQSRDYVRSLDGDIDVTSQPGVGTRFTIQLPVTYEE